jgi:hypothetical protein
MLFVFVGSLILAAAGAYWLVRRRARAKAPAPRGTKTGGRFGGVEIRIRSGACDAARRLEGQRFLAKDAPALPLPACAAAQCSCSFGKLSDRRTDGRRLEHGGLSAALFLTNNRRKKRDRRRTEPRSRNR